MGSQTSDTQKLNMIYHRRLEFFFFLNKIVPCGLGFLYAVDVPKSLSVLILAEIQWILKNQLEESWS